MLDMEESPSIGMLILFIRIKEESVLKGLRDKSGLWRVPIKENVKNKNTDTLTLQHPLPNEVASNVYDLPSIEKVIKYLHTA